MQKYFRVNYVKKQKIDEKENAFFRIKKLIPKNSGESEKPYYISEKELEKSGDGKTVSENIEINDKYISTLFENDPMIISRRFFISENKVKCVAFFLDGMSNTDAVSEQFIKPLMTFSGDLSKEISAKKALEKIIYGGDISTENKFSELVTAILSGDTLIFIDGINEAFVADTKKYSQRSVEEPYTEKTLKGPREGFVEDIMTNLSLLRRKLRTPDLKVRFFSFGRRSNTKTAVCYLDSVVNKKALSLLYERLENIDIDAVLDSNYLEEFISDRPLSTFRTVGDTERPDTAAAKIAEGRIAVIVNGCPSVITVPYLAIESFQAADDYYTSSFYSSFMRVLRIVCYFMAVSLPGLFVALIAFHSYMLPTELVMSFISARQGVPFPSIIECSSLLFAFEILRETALRVPESIGQPLSIVGALVLGDAAISARYTSAPMLIAVAVSCLAGLMVQNTKNSILFYRLLFLAFSSVLGAYGFLLALFIMTAHLFSLKSFGTDYFSYSPFSSPLKNKDYIVRAPWWAMVTFPEDITAQKYRQKAGRTK